MTSIGHILFPHCMLSPATLNGRKASIQEIPKLDGFQIWVFLKRNTYFDMIEMIAVIAKGHTNVERTRMPTLIPVI
jgi:hypothetical protein